MSDDDEHQEKSEPDGAAPISKRKFSSELTIMKSLTSDFETGAHGEDITVYPIEFGESDAAQNSEDKQNDGEVDESSAVGAENKITSEESENYDDETKIKTAEVAEYPATVSVVSDSTETISHEQGETDTREVQESDELKSEHQSEVVIIISEYEDDAAAESQNEDHDTIDGNVECTKTSEVTTRESASDQTEGWTVEEGVVDSDVTEEIIVEAGNDGEDDTGGTSGGATIAARDSDENEVERSHENAAAETLSQNNSTDAERSTNTVVSDKTESTTENKYASKSSKKKKKKKKNKKNGSGEQNSTTNEQGNSTDTKDRSSSSNTEDIAVAETTNSETTVEIKIADKIDTADIANNVNKTDKIYDETDVISKNDEITATLSTANDETINTDTNVEMNIKNKDDSNDLTNNDNETEKNVSSDDKIADDTNKVSETASPRIIAVAVATDVATTSEEKVADDIVDERHGASSPPFDTSFDAMAEVFKLLREAEHERVRHGDWVRLMTREDGKYVKVIDEDIGGRRDVVVVDATTLEDGTKFQETRHMVKKAIEDNHGASSPLFDTSFDAMAEVFKLLREAEHERVRHGDWVTLMTQEDGKYVKVIDEEIGGRRDVVVVDATTLEDGTKFQVEIYN